MSSVGSLPRRRLSSRRGSQSAPDPYALNIEADTAHAKASRITILPGPILPPLSTQGFHGTSGYPRDRSSWGSQHSAASSTGSSGSGRGRLSFAFSSFTPINGDKGTIGNGPPSPRAQRSSSSQSLDRMNSVNARARPLSPQEVCEMAHNAITQPASPGIGQTPAPTPFLLLDDEQYLPFLERPAEVTALLTSPPTNKLMALLHQTFPVDLRAPNSPLQMPTELPKLTDFGDDPEKWSYAELVRWLQTVDRDDANDRQWVSKTRKCVLMRSELIWSRLKAALGVPPELEEDEMEYDDDEGERIADYDYVDTEREAWLEPIYGDDRGTTCVASPAGSPMHPHGDQMESIGEGAEDETDTRDPSTGEAELARSIHGLRLSAPMMGVESPNLRPRSASSSPNLVPVRRSLSSAAAPDDAAAQRRRSALAAAGSSGRVRRSAQQERGTGDPLFPGSFAALTMGPSLVANNPALRSGPHRTFRPGVPITARRSGRFYSGSMSGGWDADGNDYALSLGSGSERSFL